ncbi:MAG: ligase [SAR86 cluster bacterium]|uniref:Ligase n=1 Tax=SAR86 cluster bacterium TaxID=2030880 RepID=A0A2A4WUI5_9GAMM|nr:MAG: ligase [SAR86 cluster bacterium]
MHRLLKLKTQSPGDYAYWSLGFLFLVAMHYFQLHPAGSSLTLSFNSSVWIVLSFTIGFGLYKIVSESQWVYTNLTLGLLVAVTLLLIPTFYPASIDPLNIGRLYGLLAGLLVFVVLQQMALHDRRKELLLFLLLCAVWIEALLGWSQEYIVGPGNFMGHREGYPPFGVFSQRNVMASFMATGLVLSGYLLSRFQEFSNRRFYQSVCLLTPLLTVPLILMLNSRTGWIGALVGSLLMLFYLQSKVGTRQTIAWMLMIVLGIFTGFLLLNYGDGAGLSAALSRVQSDPIRERMYYQALLLVLENPLIGVGLGNFEVEFNSFAAALNAAGISAPNGEPNLNHPHNELLFWGVEGGIAPLLGMLLAAFLVLRCVFRLDNATRFAMLGLLFPIVFHTQTEYPFYHSVVHWVVFILIIYLIDSLANEKKTRQLKSTLLVGTAAIVIPLFTTLFMVTTLQAGAILTQYERDPSTSVETLLDIRNPIVWRDRIQLKIRTDLMYQGLARNDFSQVQPYIDLVSGIVESKPRWQYFQNLIMAHDFIGQSELADARAIEARYRFPDQNFYRLQDGNFTLISVDVDMDLEQE